MKIKKALANTDWMDSAVDECMACGTLDDAHHAWNCIHNENGDAA